MGFHGTFSTGHVADICNLSTRAISSAFDKGRLKGFRVPGSKKRYIPRACLLKFLQQHYPDWEERLRRWETAQRIGVRTVGSQAIVLMPATVQAEEPLIRLAKRQLTKLGFEVTVTLDVFQAGFVFANSPGCVRLAILANPSERVPKPLRHCPDHLSRRAGNSPPPGPARTPRKLSKTQLFVFGPKAKAADPQDETPVEQRLEIARSQVKVIDLD